MEKIKVRFAPSPTGPLHIGGARSALFNYLFARHTGGSFLVRMEDTDLERSKPEYEREILDSLRWLGLEWDEGIEAGGENGPYRQTDRVDIYQEYIERLLRSGHAYHCFCTPEELEAERRMLMEKGETPRYLGRCRHLTPEERNDRLRRGLVPTVRFRVPEQHTLVVDDLVRGRVSFDTGNMGDFIIEKSDGLPTYNFAVVIDDHCMGVTHVIRAEEHLSNTPRQLLIYEALGLPLPRFAHISLILGKDRQKMSKRHGATSVMAYREQGYLPAALFNFLALMGWSPDGEQEILDQSQIISQFNLERVAKNPAVFDLDKLNWMNSQYIRQKPAAELGTLVRPYLDKSPFADQVARLDEQACLTLAEALRDYLICLQDAQQQAEVFFAPPVYGPDACAVLSGEETQKTLAAIREAIPDELDLASSQSLVKGLPGSLKLPGKKVYMPLRLALTGRGRGPELPYLLAVMGAAEVRARLEQALKLGTAGKD